MGCVPRYLTKSSLRMYAQTCKLRREVVKNMLLNVLWSLLSQNVMLRGEVIEKTQGRRYVTRNKGMDDPLRGRPEIT